MTADTLRVFFYGLFMDESLLASKGIRPTESAVGYVDGFSLHIGERATLLPDNGGRAHGVMMTLTPEEAASLYSEPSVADYAAEPVVVNLAGNERRSAVCYNLPADRLAGTNPAYAAALLELATGLGFPAGYLARIQRAALQRDESSD